MADDSTIPGELAALHTRLDASDARMRSVEEGLRANTVITKRIDDNTKDLVETFVAMQGAFKVLGWIGKAAKPLGLIAAAAAAAVSFWAALKGHLK
jgi:hypothetical protein